MNREDLILISGDDQVAELVDMFETHLPQNNEEFAPCVVAHEDGTQQWYYGKVRGRNRGLNAVAGKPRGMYDIDATSYDGIRLGCLNVDQLQTVARTDHRYEQVGRVGMEPSQTGPLGRRYWCCRPFEEEAPDGSR